MQLDQLLQSNCKMLKSKNQQTNIAIQMKQRNLPNLPRLQNVSKNKHVTGATVIVEHHHDITLFR